MCGRVGVFVRNGLVAFERVCQGAESGLTDSKISFPVLILTPVFCFLFSMFHSKRRLPAELQTFSRDNEVQPRQTQRLNPILAITGCLSLRHA
jgi:hypothetical protein